MTMPRCAGRQCRRLRICRAAAGITPRLAGNMRCRCRIRCRIRIQTPTRIRSHGPAAAWGVEMAWFFCFGMLSVAAVGSNQPTAQTRNVRELVTQLSASDPITRTRASCELRDLGDGAFEAVQPLIGLMADAAPVQADVCRSGSWRGGANDLTTPGEQAAAALVAIGTRVFQPVFATLKSPAWVARRNAAWALGALDDRRALP